MHTYIYIYINTHAEILTCVSACVYVSNPSNLCSSFRFTKNSHLSVTITLRGRQSRLSCLLYGYLCKAEAPGTQGSPRGHSSPLRGHQTDFMNTARQWPHLKDPKPRGAWGITGLRLPFTDWKTKAQRVTARWYGVSVQLRPKNKTKLNNKSLA